MTQPSSPTADANRPAASASTRPATTEWRRRSYLRVRRPAWADQAAVVESAHRADGPRA
jgi:hypothetical protein